MEGGGLSRERKSLHHNTVTWLRLLHKCLNSKLSTQTARPMSLPNPRISVYFKSKLCFCKLNWIKWLIMPPWNNSTLTEKNHTIEVELLSGVNLCDPRDCLWFEGWYLTYLKNLLIWRTSHGWTCGFLLHFVLQIRFAQETFQIKAGNAKVVNLALSKH